ncbi:unnamed protein product [Cladocopium goreaui]|uniref:Uncharacterized protein n=1 Tax=Cladocopium goreaui TaxID=2562237 RepID=A0A9P1CJC5_9DINO|nr:unnamed protein product [Cladocopium goreaui]
MSRQRQCLEPQCAAAEPKTESPASFAECSPSSAGLYKPEAGDLLPIIASEYFVLELRAAHTSGFKLRNSSSSSDNQRATKHLPGLALASTTFTPTTVTDSHAGAVPTLKRIGGKGEHKTRDLSSAVNREWYTGNHW